jgi:hypothetical protein
MTAVWRYSQAPDMSALLILLALADWADDDGYCFPSRRAIGDKTGASPSTVKRAMREHIARGEVERVAERGHTVPNPREFVGRTGFKATNLYRITLVDKLGSKRPEFLERNRARATPVPDRLDDQDWGQPEPETGAMVNAELGPGTATPIRSTRQIDPSDDTSENVQAGAAAPPPPENADENIGVITKIAHESIDLCGLSDLPEVVKSRCASLHIAYDSGVVRKAIESAQWQRRRRQAGL